MPKRAPDFPTQLVQVNTRLKLAGLGLQIEQRGQRLNLRGVLPPRPGSDRLRPYQQRIPLKLPPTIEGLKQAEQEAKIVAAQVIQHTFDWQRYQIHLQIPRSGLSHWEHQYQAFEEFFFSQPQRSSKTHGSALSSRRAASRTTWESAYRPYLRKLGKILQENPSLSLVEALYKTLRSFDYESRSRQLCCTALSAFADFLQLDLPQPLKELAGSYHGGKVQTRQLPSDEEILAWSDRIPNPHWRFVYGLMATYGLRNHEVFFSDFSALTQGEAEATLQVLSTTKTGEHEVWPFLPDWVDRFDLRTPQLPNLNRDLSTTTLQAIGQRVTRQFRRYQIPFSPYDLRHAWAVRTIHLGLPDTVAAKMMGHSVAIHTRTYHKWITRRDQQQAVQTALSRLS
ncbi:MAG: site-specific integrase [Prochlorotrichaceae cyanobacterium]